MLVKFSIINTKPFSSIFLSNYYNRRGPWAQGFLNNSNFFHFFDFLLNKFPLFWIHLVWSLINWSHIRILENNSMANNLCLSKVMRTRGINVIVFSNSFIKKLLLWFT